MPNTEYEISIGFLRFQQVIGFIGMAMLMVMIIIQFDGDMSLDEEEEEREEGGR